MVTITLFKFFVFKFLSIKAVHDNISLHLFYIIYITFRFVQAQPSLLSAPIHSVGALYKILI